MAVPKTSEKDRTSSSWMWFGCHLLGCFCRIFFGPGLREREFWIGWNSCPSKKLKYLKDSQKWRKKSRARYSFRFTPGLMFGHLLGRICHIFWHSPCILRALSFHSKIPKTALSFLFMRTEKTRCSLSGCGRGKNPGYRVMMESVDKYLLCFLY